MDKSCDQKVDTANTSGNGVLDLRFAHRHLTRQEEDAAKNSISSSKHTKLTMMPNHGINSDGELEGFVFECAVDDQASVLPLTKSSFATTAIYECLCDNGASFLKLTSNIQETTAKLREVIQSIECGDDDSEPLRFDCMPDWDSAAISQYTFKDQRAWKENVPCKMGLYHCFMRTTAQNMREHKIFIVISGSCRHASEELHNMWLDARSNITAGQFMACAELDWLRKATLRHHSRLAAQVAQKLNLHVRFIDDVNAVTNVNMLLPSTSCVFRDLVMTGSRVLLTSDAALLDRCKSGVVFDCFANEGFWVFMGPHDTGSCRMFGTEFHVLGRYQGFPTKTVRYNKMFPAREKMNVVTPHARRYLVDNKPVCVHAGQKSDVSKTKYTEGRMSFEHNPESDRNLEHILYAHAETSTTCFLFPHAGFVDVLSKIGFNQNDGIINLMPICMFCEDE